MAEPADTTSIEQPAAAADGGPLAGVAAAVLVVLSLAWVLDLHVRFGVPVYDEQPLAIAAGLSMLIAAAALALRLGGAWRWPVLAGGIALCAIMVAIAIRYPTLTIAAMMRPTWLIVVSSALIVGLLILVWRTVGLTLAAIVAVFIAVALFGERLGVPSMGFDYVSIYLLLDPNALLGLPLKVAVQIVIPYVLFGELLRLSGGGEFLTKLCLAAFGGYRGGGAKAAIGASATFGTISGNAVSNVVGTGIVTIPLIKRTGINGAIAGAVEAAASTGGQLLPPVMGAAAFVMADFLQVPYWHVVVAAALPAALYFAALFLQIDRLAARDGLHGIPADQRPALGEIGRKGAHFLIPFVALFVTLFLNQTRPELAALAGVASLVVVGAIIPFEGRRITPAVILESIVATGRSAAPLIVLTAAAGLIIGLVSLTGLGFSVAADAIAASGGSTILLLVLVALVAIVFGMGMPTVAVYVVLATVLAPALEQAGLQPIQAHLFILYYGMMSMLTPPVALASITAARLAGADPWRTSLEAIKLAWVAYVIPFLFAFSPELLLGGTAWGAALSALTAFLGIAAVSVAFAGYGRGRLTIRTRWLVGASGLALLLPPTLGAGALAANAVGAAVFALCLVRTPAVTAADSPLKRMV
ncbi:TRAP transporter permease [Amorphus orientalis]|uniref:TRAP transporter 4TM/12TM fusion protein n=1 Tax=Amorphus orientalis TaxID=649198 RepID=A0AAE4AW57_9HYPH|nr:TRAP transporter fused permease subunit [Amorphus orientalis]MDQ0317414.1 TRAP transporter 4TM/12TM fusion protein [Amorphus orientalis]